LKRLSFILDPKIFIFWRDEMANISNKKINQFFTNGDAATTQSQKAEVIEELICYLFYKIKGILLHDTNDDCNDGEVDIVFWNDGRKKGFDFLPDIIPVVCKGWDITISSNEIKWFHERIKGKGRLFGIMIAANGITENQTELEKAKNISKKALKIGRELIVLKREDIEYINTSAGLIALIKEELCHLAAQGTSL